MNKFDLKIPKKILFIFIAFVSLVCGSILLFPLFDKSNVLSLIFFLSFSFITYLILEGSNNFTNESIVFDFRDEDEKEFDELIRQKGLISAAREHLLMEAVNGNLDKHRMESRLEAIEVLELKLLEPQQLLLEQKYREHEYI